MPTRDTISIPRGTCKTINVTPKSADGTPIVLSATDTVVLTVRALASPESPILLQAESAPGTSQIQLHEDETMLPPGKYSADIRFNLILARTAVKKQRAGTLCSYFAHLTAYVCIVGGAEADLRLHT